MVTIHDTALLYDVSEAHLKKVVQLLARKGYLRAVRGHGGGYALGRPASAINLGALIRDTEPDLALVECFGTPNDCRLTGTCRLPGVFDQALVAFLAVLDRHTLRDVELGAAVFPALPA